MSHLPAYSWTGLLLIVVSEAGTLATIEPFWTWHTPIAWTGFILLVDGVVWTRRGSSWMRSAPAEFAFLALSSIPLWLIFEGYNLLIKNWHYVGLPEHPAWRTLGYAWSFATIWPAIFEGADLVASARRHAHAGQTRRPAAPQRLKPIEVGLMLAGVGCLAWPIARPSPYLAPPVWVGFILLLDPLNARAGREALVADLRDGRTSRLVNLMASGLLCGILWEFWNYWSRARWVYTVPIMADVKLFEMPLPGYFGFPAFALECFAMYVAMRAAFWRRPGRPIAL